MGGRRPLLHILGHWNHDLGAAREIVVFTNCDDVELTLNGRSLGSGCLVSDEFPFIPNPPRIWKDVPFEPGVLRVVGRHGNVELVDERATAGPPAKIRLSASPERIVADGRDISYVDATVCDTDGNRCYPWLGALSVNVTGAARLAGASRVIARGGLARVAIRSNGEPGPIVVTATAAELREGSSQIRAE
jgi:beta-galactosidase